MAASGLDSIALAVAHLERVENAALCCVAQDTATSEGDHLSSTTTLLPSLFQNHTRVVSTDHLEAKQPSSVSSSPRTTQSPPTCYCDPTPSSSVPLTEHKPWNYVSTSFMSPHSLASLHATTITGFGRPPNFYVPMAVSHPKTPEVERRCSSASPPSSSSSSPTQPKKSGTKKKNKPSSVVLSSSTSAAIPRNQPYKNLMLFFEMAPYPIPKDIQATSGDMIVSTADIQENDVLLGRGGETNHHTGNIQYRMLVKACQPAYLAAKRRDKPRIAAGIVLAVRRAGGQFLKKEEAGKNTSILSFSQGTDYWRDVGNVRAREKTSQALREGAPDLRPKLLS